MAARNSLKHGLLARSAVIMHGPVRENKAEFEELLSGLRDYYAPVGAAEELLVEEIAVSYWMERRAQVYENGEILKQARTVVSDELWKEIDDGGIDDLLEEPSDNRQSILRSRQGLEYVLGVVGQLRNQVQTKNEISEESLRLAKLDSEKEKLERLQRKVERVEAEDRAVGLRTALLLDGPKLDLLLRYTAAHERRRYRAVSRLERLQRQRKGEVVPPPIDVQVTGDASDFAKRSQ
jgi:hypothetical protein